jgi:hypothetical protein
MSFVSKISNAGWLLSTFPANAEIEISRFGVSHRDVPYPYLGSVKEIAGATAELARVLQHEIEQIGKDE